MLGFSLLSWHSRGPVFSVSIYNERRLTALMPGDDVRDGAVGRESGDEAARQKKMNCVQKHELLRTYRSNAYRFLCCLLLSLLLILILYHVGGEGLPLLFLPLLALFRVFVFAVEGWCRCCCRRCCCCCSFHRCRLQARVDVAVNNSRLVD